MKTNQSRGFTLIELLVVIAIIGILSAVVLASLNTARDKGNDAAIESDLSGIRTQAQIFHDTGNTYTGLCSDPTVANQIAGAEKANGTGTTVVCNPSTDGTTYAVSSPLVATPSTYYCVDSTGMGTTTKSALGINTAC